MRRTPGGLLAVALAAAALTGCSEFRALAGFERKVPDEFAVVSRAPLSLPPSFELPAPTPGAPRPQEGTATARAETVLFGGRRSGFYFDGQFVAAGPASGGEAALLSRAGTDTAQANIRVTVNREAAQELEDLGGFAEDLLFWRAPDQPGVVVDAEAEMRRLENNAALGLPLNEGEVPVEDQREQAPLEGLFGS